MFTQTYRVAGDETRTHYVESEYDFQQLLAWLDETPGTIAFDTETTGLEVYARDFECRLVQLGDARTAYVIPAQQFKGRLAELFARELARPGLGRGTSNADAARGGHASPTA